MPLPEPLPNESRDVFIGRCMSDPTAQEEFPEGDQRLAVCAVQFDDAKGIKQEETDFPSQGDNLEVSLRNSNYPQADWGYVNDLKQNWPDIWDKGGNIRGNEAFELWTTSRQKTSGELTDTEKDWIREREAWAARHNDNFRLAGVVALFKWGVIGSIGEDEMKKVVEEEKERLEEKSVKNKKVVSMDVKQIGEADDRVLRFSASDENPDRDGDVIRVSGWNTDNYMKNPVFLYIHDGRVLPIGKCVKVEKDLINKVFYQDIKFPTIEELTSNMDFVHEHAMLADMIYNMYKNGYMNAVSVGFDPDMQKAKRNVEGIRGWEFNGQELLELSAVPIPANPNALVQAKSFSTDDVIKAFEVAAEKYADEDTGRNGYRLQSYWCEDEKANEIAKLAFETSIEYNVDVERVVVDGKESQVSVLDKNDKGIRASFSFFENGEGSLSISSEYLKSKPTEKALDFNGMPSTWDIEMRLDSELPEDQWTIGLYPVNYPSGHALVRDCENDTVMMHDYTYDHINDIVVFGDGREIEMTMQLKALCVKGQKAGARNSAKDAQTILETMDHMQSAMDLLNTLMDQVTASEHDEEEKEWQIEITS